MLCNSMTEEKKGRRIKNGLKAVFKKIYFLYTDGA